MKRVGAAAIGLFCKSNSSQSKSLQKFAANATFLLPICANLRKRGFVNDTNLKYFVVSDGDFSFMNSERNLLLGLLAFQNGFITQDQLLTAFGTWVSNKSRGMADYLIEQKALSIDMVMALERMVDLHLIRFDGDAKKSLASLSIVGSTLRTELEHMAKGDNGAMHTVSFLASIGTSISPGSHDKFGNEEIRLSSRLDSNQTSRQSPGADNQRFRIVHEHARGGLGIVFVAEDQQINRRVALKQIRSDRADLQDYRHKFEQEAKITGQLEHPGIVPIYALGTNDEGRPYYAMRFIRGEDLQSRIRKFHTVRKDRNLPFDCPELRGLLRRFVDVCNAIDYAHDRGVLHRDLKPGNIMLGKHGETLVVDWGLAKTMSAEPEINQYSTVDFNSELPIAKAEAEIGSETLYGQFVGTPAYAPPEQMLGQLDKIGPASDVYSLGVILYEVLTGKVPISGKSLDEIRSKSTHGDYPPPYVVNPSVPKALDAVCRKALSVEPNSRYHSARALREEIERWLDDTAVLAINDSIAVSMNRWIRHHPAIAAASVATLFLVFAGAISYGILSNSHVREVQLKNYELAAKNEKIQSQSTEVEERSRELEATLYASRMNLARIAWEKSDVKRTLGLLDLYRQNSQTDADLRGFEWHFLDRLCNLSLGTLKLDYHVPRLAISPDGNRAAVPDREEQYSLPTPFSIFDLSTGQKILTFFKNSRRGFVEAMSWSPDGKRIAILRDDGTRAVTVCDAISGIELSTTLSRPLSTVRDSILTYSPDGKWIASSTWFRFLRSGSHAEFVVWNADTWESALSVKSESHTADTIKEIAFSPDSKQIAARSQSSIKLWDIITGELVRSITLQTTDSASWNGLAFSPDGRQVATKARGKVKILNFLDGNEIHELDGNRIASFAFSPEGKRLAIGSEDSTVSVWDIESQSETVTLRGHGGSVTNVAFSSDGRRLVSLFSDEGEIKSWDSILSHESYVFPGHTREVYSLKFSDDGRFLASGSWDGTVKIWDTETKHLLKKSRIFPPNTRDVSFNKDGTLIATVGDGGFVRFWDVTTNTVSSLETSPKVDFRRVVFSPDGRRFAAVTTEELDHHICIWNARTLQMELKFDSVWMENSFDFSANGQRLVYLGPSGRVNIWDFEKQEQVAIPNEYLKVSSAVYSRDGRYLVIGDEYGTIQLLDQDCLNSIRSIRSFGGSIRRLSISGDGKRLLSEHRKGSRLWDTFSGQEVWNWKDGFGMEMSQDGLHFAIGEGRKIRILEGVPLTQERQNQLEARGLIQFLFSNVQEKTQVLELVRSDKNISDSLRSEALSQLESWLPDVDTSKLNNDVWETVRHPGTSLEQNQAALRKAEIVCLLEPYDFEYLNTLGVAQFRVGAFQKAQETFLKAEEIVPGTAENLVFLSMVQFHLGNTEQAKITLATVRRAMKKNAQLEGLIEAEALIEEFNESEKQQQSNKSSPDNQSTQTK